MSPLMNSNEFVELLSEIKILKIKFIKQTKFEDEIFTYVLCLLLYIYDKNK